MKACNIMQIEGVQCVDLIHCNVITTVAFANTSMTSHNYHSFLVARTFNIYSLSNFQVYDVVS